MFDTVLVADRGLVACRVVGTLQRLGVRTITVHSADDADRLHSRCADESLLLGPADPAATYLDGLKVIEAAGQSGAQAVHPGASPLAASAAFATAVQDAGLTWVGAAPEALAALAALAGAPAAQAPPPARTVTVLAPPDAAPLVLGESVGTGALVVCPSSPGSAAHAAAVEAVRGAGVAGLARVGLDDAARAVAVEPWLGPDAAAVELVTGLDLVEQQLLLAAGRDVVRGVDPRGAAVQVALLARSAGRVERLALPEGDGLHALAGVREGEDVPAGELVLSLAVWGQSPAQAHERLEAARGRLVVDGIELEERP